MKNRSCLIIFKRKDRFFKHFTSSFGKNISTTDNGSYGETTLKINRTIKTIYKINQFYLF